MEDVSSRELGERLREDYYVDVTELEDIDGNRIYTLDVEFESYHE